MFLSRQGSSRYDVTRTGAFHNFGRNELLPIKLLPDWMVVTVVLWMFPALGYAHGGFPTALGVSRVGAVATGSLVIHTNFGVLVDRDGLRLVCEEQYGGSGQPVVVLPNDNVFIAGHFKGIARSEDAGCTLISAPVAGSGLFVREFAQHPGGGLYLVTSTGGATNGVYVSNDIGKSWRLFGPGSDELFYTGIRVLGENGDLAAAGINGEEGTFFLSYYFAATKEWKSTILPGFTTDAGQGGQPILVDCSPNGLQCLVVGTDDLARRILEVGRDGAVRVVFEQSDAIFLNAAYSPAGEIFVGNGVQLLRSPDQTTWIPVFGIDSPTCISRVGQELFVCSNPYLPDSFLVTRSVDNGETWSVIVHRFDEIRSLQPCDVGDELSLNCSEPWQQLATDFGIEVEPDVPVGPSPDAQWTDMDGHDSADVAEGPAKPKSDDSGCAAHFRSPAVEVGALVILVGFLRPLVRRGSRGVASKNVL